jgi:ribose transport system permease protein
MLGLTIVGGLPEFRKPKESVAITLPAGTDARVEQGTMVVSTTSSDLASRLQSVLVHDNEGNLILDHAGTRNTLRSEMRPSLNSSGQSGVDVMTLVVRPAGTTNTFLNLANLFLVLVFASFIAIMAVGMTGVITMGGIDLSVGSIYGLSALYGALALHAMQKSSLGLGPNDMATSVGGMSLGVALPVALFVCCGVGALAGLLNGALIVGLRVHPFVITLGTMAAYRGWIALPAKAQTVGEFPESLTRDFFKSDWWGVTPVPVLFMVLAAIAGMFVLSRTVFGRRVFAIGGNEIAAYYAGIPVGRTKLFAYTIMGALAGLAACVYLGYFGAASPDAGNGYELQVIAAAVIGGASLSGGRGTALGAVLGAILVELLKNGMLILQIDSNYNQIVMGVAIILAVVMDQLKTRLTPLGK